MDKINLISQEQLNNAKLYSTKIEFIKHIPKGGHFLEIGTLGGDYAEPLLSAQPSSLDLLDTFESRDWAGSDRFDSAVDKKFDEYPFILHILVYLDILLS